MALVRILMATLAAGAFPLTVRAPMVEPLPAPLQSLPAPPELRVQERPAAQAIKAFIREVNPDVPVARAGALAASIIEASEARGLDPLVLTGILALESHFHADVQSCHPRGCDLGVGQIHWETWGEALGLDRHRLIHDDRYGVGVAATILADVRRRHGAEGGRWWTRYHDRRPERRAQYAALVLAHGTALLGSL